MLLNKAPLLELFCSLCVAHLGMNLRSHDTIPRKLCASLIVRGCGYSFIAFTFLTEGLSPSWVATKPRMSNVE